MTLPHQTPPRKPRRWFLYAPWIAFAVLLVGWSGFWIYLRGETLRRLETAAADARAAGWDIAWTGRSLSGFPFRLELVLDQVAVTEPSGWGVTAPQLRAEAFAYALGRWVAYVPEGLTLSRPGAAPMRIQAKALRASLGGLERTPPRLSVEGTDLTFAAASAVSAPPVFTRAAKLQIHLRPGPDDQGAALFRLDGAAAEPSRWLGRVAQGRPVTVVFDGLFTQGSALKGRSWAAAIQAWTAAGGRMTLRNAELTAGDAALKAASGTLSVGVDGRLRGDLQAELRSAPRALAALGDTGAASPEAAAAAAAVAAARQGATPLARAAITFEAGQTTLGPVALGPAPRVF